MLQKKKSSGGRRFSRQDDTEEVTEAAAPAETTVADRYGLVKLLITLLFYQIEP